jgi:hypothetical protein
MKLNARKDTRGETMASSNQQNAANAMHGTEWMLHTTDQFLNQSKTMWESSLTTARDAFDSIEQQTSEIRGRLLFSYRSDSRKQL